MKSLLFGANKVSQMQVEALVEIDVNLIDEISGAKPIRCQSQQYQLSYSCDSNLCGWVTDCA